MQGIARTQGQLIRLAAAAPSLVSQVAACRHADRTAQVSDHTLVLMQLLPDGPGVAGNVGYAGAVLVSNTVQHLQAMTDRTTARTRVLTDRYSEESDGSYKTRLCASSASMPYALARRLTLSDLPCFLDCVAPCAHLGRCSSMC
jgi:hypothetical protein